MKTLIDLTPFTNLFYYGLGLLASCFIGYVIGALQSKEWGDKKLEKSRNLQRRVLKGTIAEQLAPFLPNFPKDLKPSEAKFIGAPIDLIVFKGMDDKNISEVVFVEVKSGRQYRNPNEDSLKKAIENKRVRYVPYQTPAIEASREL